MCSYDDPRSEGQIMEYPVYIAGIIFELISKMEMPNSKMEVLFVLRRAFY